MSGWGFSELLRRMLVVVYVPCGRAQARDARVCVRPKPPLAQANGLTVHCRALDAAQTLAKSPERKRHISTCAWSDSRNMQAMSPSAEATNTRLPGCVDA